MNSPNTFNSKDKLKLGPTLILLVALSITGMGLAFYIRYNMQSTASTPVVPLAQALAEKNYTTLEQEFAALQSAYINSKGSDRALANAFGAVVRPGLAETKQKLDDWVAAMPQSAFALTARGLYRYETAWMYRGSNYWNNVPEQRRAQFTNNINRGWDDLWAALKLNPDLGPARTKLVQGAHAKGEEQTARTLYAQGAQRTPLDADLHAAQLWGLQPKWNGRPGEIESFISTLEADKSSEATQNIAKSMRALYMSYQADDDYRNEVKYEKTLLAALEAAPKNSTIHRKLGELYMNKENLPEARRHLDIALDSNPLDETIWAARARLRFMEKDRTGGIADYVQAAELGDTDAMLRLVYAYMENFESSGRDGPAARFWAQRLTTFSDDTTAQVLMGMIYEIGYGAEKVPEEALRFYSRAAAQDDADGQARLGLMLWEGRGTPANRDKAVELWNAAAAQNHGWAKQLLASHTR